jgi:hypothetical protein
MVTLSPGIDSMGMHCGHEIIVAGTAHQVYDRQVEGMPAGYAGAGHSPVFKGKKSQLTEIEEIA